MVRDIIALIGLIILLLFVTGMIIYGVCELKGIIIDLNPKHIFCKHDWICLTNFYGDSINFYNCRSIYKCKKCGKYKKSNKLDENCKIVNWDYYQDDDGTLIDLRIRRYGVEI